MACYFHPTTFKNYTEVSYSTPLSPSDYKLTTDWGRDVFETSENLQGKSWTITMKVY